MTIHLHYPQPRLSGKRAQIACNCSLVTLPDGFVVETYIFNPDPKGLRRKMVFYHGLGGSPLMMLMLPWLAARHNVTIYAPCLPGHGRSHDKVMTFDELVDRLAGWSEQLGLVDVPHMGYSLGGLAAARLATVRPDLVSYLIGLAMPTERPQDGHDRNRYFTSLTYDTYASYGAALVCATPVRKGPQLLLAGIQSLMGSPRLLAVIRIAMSVTEDMICPDPNRSEFMFGGADRAARVPTEERLNHAPMKVLKWHPHGYPMLPWTWFAISGTLARALNPELRTRRAPAYAEPGSRPGYLSLPVPATA